MEVEVHFSRFAAGLGGPTNRLAQLRERLAAQGAPITDLVRGNVNEHGIVYPPDVLDEILADATRAARVYRPDPLGQRPARETIAQYYAGLDVAPEHIVLTPGTSLSYWYVFKLLAEPGDALLCPQPSYPLFEHIAQLAGLEMRPYRLDERRAWAIDLEHLENQLTTRSRAVILISPHNPTGMVASADQLDGLAAIARRHGLPIIADEVFSEFLFGPASFPRAAATDAPLVFTLNGLSKMFALPGMKIGWMAVSGKPALVRRSLAALELISDTFLPVNEIAQAAVPGIFAHGGNFLQTYKGWIARCRTAALAGLQGCRFVEPAGGFYVSVCTAGDEEAAALGLLERHRILVHPGYFYDMPPNHLVMTFIDAPDTVRRHFETIASWCVQNGRE